jgi:hypothetical protein
MRRQRISSSTKTATLTTMMPAVTTGTLAGRRDASPNGTMPPILSSSVSVNAGFQQA